MHRSATAPGPRVGRSWRARGLALLLAGAALFGTILPMPASAQVPGPANLAMAMARIGQLEEEIRRLRGQVERLEYDQRQLQSFLDDKLAEMERRLTTARAEPEAPVGAIGPAVTPPLAPALPGRANPPPAQTAATSPPARAEIPPSIATDPSAKRGYVLGTIPADAVRTPQEPPPQTTAALPPAATAGDGSPSGRYNAARELLRRGNWGEAELAFSKFVEDFPSDAQASNAAYWLGETYFVRQDWAKSAATFARNYSTYGNTAEKAPDNLLKLGMSLQRLGETAKACQTFDELGRRHANAPASIKQVMARERAAAGCG